MRAKALFVLGLVGLVAVACGTNTNVASSPTTTNGPQRMTLNVSGLERAYYVLDPPNRKGRVPLVIALHGGTGSAQAFERNSRLDEEARRTGFIVVYPDGVDRAWNAGKCCGNADDVGFIRQVIDRLVSTGRVDTSHVFATGLSNGGMMVHRLACEVADRISAVASVAGALTVDACSPTRPVSVLEIHGTADDVVPFGGGKGSEGIAYPSTPSTMKRWADLDGCSPSVSLSGSGQISNWYGCLAGVSVVLYSVAGGGHINWFNPANGDPDANKVVWDFLSRVPSRE